MEPTTNQTQTTTETNTREDVAKKSCNAGENTSCCAGKSVGLKNTRVLRQAFVVGSSIIILGFVLEALVDEVWGLLPLLVAGGLMFAGLTGVCPMVLILQQMPWNKK